MQDTCGAMKSSVNTTFLAMLYYFSYVK